jgi:Pilus formation protein N terminal region
MFDLCLPKRVRAKSASARFGVPDRVERLPILHLFRVLWTKRSVKGQSAHMAFRISPKRSHRGLAIAALLAIGGAQTASAGSNDVEVLMDQAVLVKLDRPAAEIVVGNPSIADVSVQSGKVLVVTGKSYGETNLIVLDADGKVIIDRRLAVQDPRAGLVTVYKGSAHITLDCAPNCTTPLVIGDEPDHFEAISKQIKSKQGISQSSAEGEKPGE